MKQSHASQATNLTETKPQQDDHVSSKKIADTLIEAEWIIPVDPSNRILQQHALVIREGKIIDILPSEQAQQEYQPAQHLDLHNQILIPGLINTHGHAAMSLLRGLADDLPLMAWLTEHIWPAEQRLVCDEFVATGTELAIAEMLLSGTTCFSDMYFYPDVAAKIAHQHKIRAHLSVPILEFPSPWANNADEYIQKGLAVFDNYRNHPLIQIGFGPHAPYTVSDESLSRIATLANELDATIQIHLHETAKEVSDAVSESGQRPIQRLESLGLLSPRLQCVHMTQVDDSDLNLLDQYGCHIIHCPESNLKLASGICPVTRLLETGINVALGTDGAASNNDLNLLGEMRTAALLAKAESRKATAVPAQQALRMATINGAKALGIDHITGSLEVGKAADIVAIDVSDIILQPLHNPLSQLVYTDCSRYVSHVWINGEPLVTGGKLKNFDLHTLNNKVQSWRDKITALDQHH
ncbi:MAG: TRZ/ATZ family hydrolase [Pseudomonadales bacterium]